MSGGDEFEYNPGQLVDYVQALGTFSGQLEDVRAQAQHLLNGVHGFFVGDAAEAFTRAQMLINSGIDAGQEVIRRHSMTVDNVHQNTISQDASAAASFGV